MRRMTGDYVRVGIIMVVVMVMIAMTSNRDKQPGSVAVEWGQGRESREGTRLLLLPPSLL